MELGPGRERRQTLSNPKVRAILLFFIALTFGVLVFGGYLINREKPPVPETILAPSGQVIFSGEDIFEGRELYFSRGGQHIGSIWGHGSYLAPDWSADYLHRMGLFLAARHLGLTLEEAKRFTQKDFDAVDALPRSRLSALVQEEINANRSDPKGRILRLPTRQTEAVITLTAY